MRGGNARVFRRHSQHTEIVQRHFGSRCNHDAATADFESQRLKQVGPGFKQNITANYAAVSYAIGAILASLALWIIVSGQVGGHTGGFGASQGPAVQK